MVKWFLVLLVYPVLGLASAVAVAQDKSADGSPGKTLRCEKGRDGCIFSRDGRRVAYASEVGGGGLIVLDGQEGKRYAFVREDLLVFSKDGQHVAYAACEQRNCTETHQWLIVRDGEEVAVPGVPLGISLSPDGSRMGVALESRKVRGSYVVLDGEVQRSYDKVLRPIFSDDGRRYAYLAERERKVFLVVDGKEELGPFDGMRARFSSDGRRLLYEARAGDKTQVVLDGQELGQYDEVTDAVFSDDGQQVAYAARVGQDAFVVVNGKPGKAYREIWKDSLRFSPDGKRVGFIAVNKTGGNYWVPVVDGKEGAKFDWGTPLVSHPGSALNLKVSGTLVFSPDGKRVAHLAHWAKPYKRVERSGKDVSVSEGSVTTWALVLDGKVQRSYEEIRPGSVVFSPDGRHVSYVAKSKGREFVVVDTREGAPFQGIWPPWGGASFDSSTSVRYLAYEGNRIYSVTGSVD